MIRLWRLIRPGKVRDLKLSDWIQNPSVAATGEYSKEGWAVNIEFWSPNPNNSEESWSAKILGEYLLHNIPTLAAFVAALQAKGIPLDMLVTPRGEEWID
jgi:hypothetical protein